MPALREIEIKSSDILTIFDLEKSESASEQHTGKIIPLSVPTKQTTSGHTNYTWLEYLHPRNYHGKWASKGKALERIKQQAPEKTITRVKEGSIVFKNNKPAKVLHVINRGEYLIQHGLGETGPTEIVKKTEIEKQHYKYGGSKKDALFITRQTPQHIVELPVSNYTQKQTEDMVNTNLESIDKRAKSHYNGYLNAGIDLSTMGLTLDDIVQEGRLAAIKFTPAYDKKRGEYLKYIYNKIDQQVKRAIADKTSSWGLIHIPEEERLQLARIKGYVTKYKKDKGIEPTQAQIIEWANTNIKIPESETVKLLNMPKEVYSIHSVMPGKDDEGENELLYRIPDPSATAEEQLLKQEHTKRILTTIEKILTPQETQIIKLKFGLGEGNAGIQYDTAAIKKILTKEGMQIEERTIRKTVKDALDKLSRNKGIRNLISIPVVEEGPKHIVII